MSKYAEIFAHAPLALAQQSPAWGEVIAPLGPDTPHFLTRGNAGLPLFHFQGPAGGILTSVPQAGPLGGVLLGEGAGPEAYAELVGEARELARRLGCAALTIISNPFHQDDALYEKLAPAYSLRNFAQIIELGARKTKAKWNNDIARNLEKAREAGVKVSWSTPATFEADFDAWFSIHRARHAELGARTLPEALLRGILTRVKSGLAVARSGDKVVGGCMFVWERAVADAFIMSTAAEWLSHGVNYAVTEFALAELAARGMRWLNWQSSPRNSGVYAFKERWGSEHVDYSFHTWTFEPFQKILALPPDSIGPAYPWHYVAPFEALRDRKASGIYVKM